MKLPSRPHTNPEEPTWMLRLQGVHPYQMMLYLAMIGSGLIFTYLMFAYTFTRVVVAGAWSFHVPKPFIVSTLILVFSSFWLVQIRRAFVEEDYPQVGRKLGYVLMLGLLFAGLQVWGWWVLIQDEVEYSTSRTSAGYLYVMSALHLLHLLGGLIFLAVVITNVRRATKDPVAALLTATTPKYHLRLRMLVSYWHYLDIIWVAMFFFFLFTL